MSKGNSGLFPSLSHNTSSSPNNNKPGPTENKMHSNVKNWAEREKEKLHGKAKKGFNTACVVYDESTGKHYYGKNAGYKEPGYVKNPILFGDSTHPGLLPKESLNKYPIGNCAEVDAINKALNDGANINNLHMTVIHTTNHQFGSYKESCENCNYAFRGKVKINYSGWKEGN
ncbi:MAG: hypothetical protein IJK60_07580 [Clostridia bacterium]|nr:hypothetical protein [Clostridia bacterium]